MPRVAFRTNRFVYMNGSENIGIFFPSNTKAIYRKKYLLAMASVAQLVETLSHIRECTRFDSWAGHM